VTNTVTPAALVSPEIVETAKQAGEEVDQATGRSASSRKSRRQPPDAAKGDKE
jgi:hypothetical protein